MAYDFSSMRLTFSALPFVLVFACGPSQAVFGDFLRVGEVRRSEVRDAVAAHRFAQREEVQREEAAAGRRLTAAELFELRQQVRGQWTLPSAGALAHSAESQPAERIVPAPAPDSSNERSLLTAPRSQRR
ncbi:hypothetical protein [Variovorax sp. H27-G14]|uniref:hypothetical protein n=1 Tax=Variovorax sp. H27-G14 TaxID=3111914 RepID=UPI0038FD0D92